MHSETIHRTPARSHSQDAPKKIYIGIMHSFRHRQPRSERRPTVESPSLQSQTERYAQYQEPMGVRENRRLQDVQFGATDEMGRQL